MTKYSLTKDHNGMITYQYATNDWAFKTELLCEVGAPYQARFKDEISRRGWTIQTRELDGTPWMADFVIEAKP